jgi:adenosylcobinamide-phosphate synthase
MLENGHDAVLATLVSYLIGGAPLVIVHRLANTLDAMWGYRNERFNYFGRFSARADDVLGFISAKTTSLLFAVQALNMKRILCILKQAYQQARNYKSHNGGWVMSSGATLIKVQLGGEAIYHGKVIKSPVLGQGAEPQTQHIQLSLTRVKYAALLLIFIAFIAELTSKLLG